MATDIKRAPEIRFDEFTEAWEQHKLWDVTDEFKSGSFIAAANIEEEGEYPVYGGNGLRGYANSYNHDGEFALIGRQGALCGNMNYSTGKAYITEHAVAVKANNSSDTKFLFYLLDTMRLGQYSDQSAQPGLAVGKLTQMESVFPTQPEQEMIAEYFTNLDNLITLHQRKCASLKNLKKACLTKMFPKNGERVPEIRFEGFTEAWEQRKFSEVIDINSGMDYKRLGEGSVPVYGTGGYMLSVNKSLSEDKDAIGIGRKGTIDKPYILRAPFWTVDTLFYCIPKQNYDLDFINCLFKNVDWKKKDESTGVPSLSKLIINNVETSIPKYEEQKRIGEYFRNLDNLITLHQRKCDKLKNIKKAMLQKMFI